MTNKEKSNYQGKRAIIKYSPKEVESFMKIIKLEFYSFFDLNKTNIEHKSFESNSNSYTSTEEEQNSKLYYFNYTNYILQEFNSSIVNMMILYINENKKSFPKEYKLEQDFNYNMINLLKYLMMNEIEVAYFTLLIDKLGWKYEKIDHWIYFTILGIITKNECLKGNNTFILITIFSRRYPNFQEIYSNFINDEKISSLINEKNITIEIINKRFIQLSKPTNTYCRKNYINLDGIIDKIVYMSHPYSKSSSNYSKKKTEIKNTKINNFTQIEQYENLFNMINKHQNDFSFGDIKNIGNYVLNNLSDEVFSGGDESFDSLNFENI